MVEMRGIEPLSNVMSIKFSPGAAVTFSIPLANSQSAYICSSSFIDTNPTQSFAESVPLFNLQQVRSAIWHPDRSGR